MVLFLDPANALPSLKLAELEQKLWKAITNQDSQIASLARMVIDLTSARLSESHDGTAKRPLTYTETILENILKGLPYLECQDFDHSKKDRHGDDEACPVEARFNNWVKLAHLHLNSIKE